MTLCFIAYRAAIKHLPGRQLSHLLFYFFPVAFLLGRIASRRCLPVCVCRGRARITNGPVQSCFIFAGWQTVFTGVRTLSVWVEDGSSPGSAQFQAAFFAAPASLLDIFDWGKYSLLVLNLSINTDVAEDFFFFATCLPAFSPWSILVHQAESWNGTLSQLPSKDPRICRARTLRKPDLAVWVISRFSHREQGHEGEEIAAITGLRPASFLSCAEYNHFHNIKHSYLDTGSFERLPSHLYASFWRDSVLCCKKLLIIRIQPLESNLCSLDTSINVDCLTRWGGEQPAFAP